MVQRCSSRLRCSCTQEEFAVKCFSTHFHSFTLHSSLELCESFVMLPLMLLYRNLNLGYLDLYLIHWPVSSKPGKYKFPIDEDDFFPMNFRSVWADMEECKRLGLAKSIGVSNFSCKKLSEILSIASIPPAVNQVSSAQ